MFDGRRAASQGSVLGRRCFDDSVEMVHHGGRSGLEYATDTSPGTADTGLASRRAGRTAVCVSELRRAYLRFRGRGLRTGITAALFRGHTHRALHVLVAEHARPPLSRKQAMSGRLNLFRILTPLLAGGIGLPRSVVTVAVRRGREPSGGFAPQARPQPPPVPEAERAPAKRRRRQAERNARRRAERTARGQQISGLPQCSWPRPPRRHTWRAMCSRTAARTVRRGSVATMARPWALGRSGAIAPGLGTVRRLGAHGTKWQRVARCAPTGRRRSAAQSRGDPVRSWVIVRRQDAKRRGL